MTLDALITRLRGLDSDPSPEDVADILWLLAYVPGPISHWEAAPDAAQGARAPIVPGPAAEGPPQNVETPASTASDLPAGGEDRRTVGVSPAPPPSRSGAGEAGGERLADMVGGARALPDSAGFVRALRPLKSKVRSPRKVVLDEEATARRIAEERLSLPVFVPARTRWLDLAIIVDNAPTMAVWGPTVREFVALMRGLGAFDSVRVYRLDTAESHRVRLLDESGGSELALGEPADPQGRRVVLVLTDATAPAWYGKELKAMVRNLGLRQPVALALTLPAWQWGHTALAGAAALRASAYRRAERAGGLAYRALSPRFRRPVGGLPLPVFSLTAAGAEGWVRTLAALGGGEVGAVLLDSIGGAPPPGSGDLSTEARLAEFHARASGPARRLAALFAATPLQMGVMRVIAETLPEADLGHLAEVVGGGLMRHLESSGEETWFEFHDGVREVLLDDADPAVSLETFRRASLLLERREPGAFPLRVVFEEGASDGERDTPLGSFARLGRRLLRRERPTTEVADLGGAVVEEDAFVGDVVLKAGALTGGCWTADGSEFVLAAGRSLVHVAPDGTVRETPIDEDLATAVAAGSDHLVVGFDHGGPAFHALRSGTWTKPGEALRGRIDDASVSGPLIAVCSREDGVVAHRWNGTELELHYASRHRGAICVSVHPDGTRLAVGYENGDLMLAGFHREERLPGLHRGPLNSLCWNPKTHHLATASSDGRVLVTRGTSGGEVVELAHEGEVVGVSFRHDGGALAVLEFSGRVRLWSCDGWLPLETFEGPRAGYYGGLAFNPRDGRLAVYPEEGGSVALRRVDPTGRGVRPADRPVAARRALIVSFTEGYDFVRRNDRLLTAALESLGFAVTVIADPDSFSLARSVEALVDGSGDDDFMAIHVNGYGEAVRGALALDPVDAGAPRKVGYDLLRLNELLSRRPSLRALLSLDAGETPFIAECGRRLTRCAVIGIDLEESDVLEHGVFSHALAQAFAAQPRSGRATTLRAIFDETETMLAEFEPKSRRRRLVAETRGLDGTLLTAAAMASSSKPWLGRRVLWADDSPPNNRALIDAFLEKGAMVTLATDTVGALRLYDRYRFDAVLTDMGRPSDPAAGYTLIDALRSRGPLPACVVFTARHRPEHQATAVKCGAIGSTSDARQVLAWLDQAFDPDPGRSRAREARTWVSHLRFVYLEKGGRLQGELAAAFHRWLEDAEGPEALPALVEWLDLTRDFEAVGRLVGRWLERHGEAQEARDLYVSWMAASRQKGRIQPAMRKWLARFGSSAEARNLLLTLYQIEPTPDNRRLVLKWLQKHPKIEEIARESDIWNALPISPLKIANIAMLAPREGARDRHDWEVFIDETAEVLDSVLSVEYILHETFTIPIRISTRRDYGFALQSSGWGSFIARLIITRKGGARERGEHHVSFDAPSSKGIHRLTP